MRSSLGALVFGSATFFSLFVGVSFARGEGMDRMHLNTPIIVQEGSGNLYQLGENFFSAGTISKDVLTAGQLISINHNVSGDALVGGAQVIFGPQTRVLGDLRAVGGTFASAAKVGGDLMVAAGNITLDGASTVSGLTILAGGQVVVNGKLAGTVRIFAGDVTFNAQAAGNVLIKAENLSFGSDAAIQGNLDYHAKTLVGNPDDVTAGAVTGAMMTVKDKHLTNKDDRYTNKRGMTSRMQMLCILSTIVFSLLLYLPLRRFWEEHQAHALFQAPGRTIGIGLLVYILLPIAAVLLMMTIIGLPIGALLLVSYIFMFVLANIVNTCSFLGILHKGLPQHGRKAGVSLVGATIALALIFSHFWWISFLFSIWTYGGLSQLKMNMLKDFIKQAPEGTKHHH